MSLSLDASELIHVLRAQSRHERARFDAAVLDGAQLLVATPVVHELHAGAWHSARPDHRLRQVQTLLATVTAVEFTAVDAEVSGRLWADLRRRGRAIGDIDTLIAGQALARGWTVVTRNVRHFGRVPDLALIDWSVGAEPLSAEQIAARVAEPE